MGLDNYWNLPEKTQKPRFEPPLKLCGGMFSNQGEGSFRGKVYTHLIEKLSGYSLYTETLQPQQIQEIAKVMEETPWLTIKNLKLPYPIEETEYQDLQRMFKTYGENNAELKSWW